MSVWWFQKKKQGHQHNWEKWERFVIKEIYTNLQGEAVKQPDGKTYLEVTHQRRFCKGCGLQQTVGI